MLQVARFLPNILPKEESDLSLVSPPSEGSPKLTYLLKQQKNSLLLVLPSIWHLIDSVAKVLYEFIYRRFNHNCISKFLS